MTSRTKALLGGAATVVVLAAVILGLWAFGSPKKNVPTITLSAQQRSAQALKDGRAALSKEQTQTAIQLFQTALTIDPGNTEAQSALNDVNSGKSASTNTGSSSTTKGSSTTTKTPAPPSVWTGDVDVSGLLPTAFPTFPPWTKMTLLSQPESLTVAETTPVAFSVTADGWPISYQWFKDGPGGPAPVAGTSACSSRWARRPESQCRPDGPDRELEAAV